MAIFHLNIKIITRGKGMSAVSAAAYRAGVKITNAYDGVTHDYTRKTGVVHTEIILPGHAPRIYYDRSVLWNAVENVEKAKNSQLAREIDIALPVELSREQNLELVRNYVKNSFVDKGMCADISIHDNRDGNPHAHIMLTMRPINENGIWGSKQKKEYILDKCGKKIYDPKKKTYKCRSVESTDWNDRDKAEEWRKAWADSVNEYLKKLNQPVKIDHRSYIRQGIEQIPTIHLGPAAWQMEKRGIQTDLGNINREIEVTNKELRMLNARIRKAKNELFAMPLADAPSMIDVAKNVHAWHTLDTRLQKIQKLQSFVKIHEFMFQNGIRDIGDLATKAESMYDESRELFDDVKKTDKRMDTLALHLSHVDTRNKYRSIIRAYNKLDPKKRDKFYTEHKKEIDDFKKSGEYLTKIMNGKTPIPVKEWEAEYKKLAAKRFSLCDRYYDLHGEIKSVEKLRRSAEELIRDVYSLESQHRSFKQISL